MSAPKKFDAAAFVANALPALALEIDPAWMPGIVGNFARTAELAALVLEFELGEEDEAAPVFVP